MSSRTQTIDSPPSARAVSPAIPSPLLVAELRPEMFAVPVPEQMDDVGAQPLTESSMALGARGSTDPVPTITTSKLSSKGAISISLEARAP